jgi:hypothetical protein
LWYVNSWLITKQIMLFAYGLIITVQKCQYEQLGDSPCFLSLTDLISMGYRKMHLSFKNSFN